MLVVEDERVVALDLRDSLEDMGYQVVDILARGEDATAAGERLRPDLVLMDIHLAGQMTGTEAASLIRERLDIPVIFLTAYSDSATLERAADSLPHGYLVKPFDKRELDATLRMALTRHRAEVEVQRSERRLRLALEAARMGVWEWETATGLFESSHEIFDILGRPHEQASNGLQALLERFQPKDRERVSANLLQGEAVNLTLELFGNGPRWVELSAKAFPGGGDRIGRVVGVMRDVTESQQTQAKLRQARAVFETTSEGIAITDAQLRIVSVNPAFCRITSSQSAIGRALGASADVCQNPNAADLQALREKFDKTIGGCNAILAGYEKQASQAKWTLAGIAIVGGVAGSIGVPALVAKASVSKSEIAGWSGLSGVSNFAQHVFVNDGLAPADSIKVREGIRAQLSIDPSTNSRAQVATTAPGKMHWPRWPLRASPMNSSCHRSQLTRQLRRMPSR